jgi:predicted amidohydrolase
MRVAVVQTDPVFGSVEHNVGQALSLVQENPADLYVLPELFNTGYNFLDAAEVVQYAEPTDGPTFKAVADVASRRSCYIAYGFAESGGRLYNSSLLVGPDGLIGHYRKVHLFFRETLLFAAGDLGFPVYDLPFGRVGMMICFDWLYPEAARSLALQGAQLILHPSNLVLPHCPDAMVTRCLENRVFSATANRIGSEQRGGVGLTYIGRSEIVAPSGSILGRMDDTTAGVLSADIDLELAKNKRLNDLNDLFDDRKPDQYRIG